MNSLISEILTRAAEATSAAEVFLFSSEETPVSFEANRLKSVQNKQSVSAALRVFRNGRIGFASSSNPANISGLVAAAVETSEFGAKAEFDFPPQAEFPAVEVYDPAVEKAPLDQMVRLGEEMIAAVTAHTPNIICEAAVSRATLKVALANTSGLNAEYSASRFSTGIEGTLIQGSDMLFVGDGDSSCRLITDASGILANVKRQLDSASRQAAIRTGRVPVIFSPDGVASALTAPLITAFNGKLVLEGASPLKDKLNTSVFDAKLNIYDDTTVSFRPGSRPFDGEGIPSRRLPMVETGMPRNYLYDLKTAASAGAASTGHGGRGGGAPSPSPGAFVFDNGDISVDAMIADIREGLFIEQVMGATQGNILGGDFSGNVLLGYKIENGRITGRVKNTMVFGNIYDLLKNIAGIGNDGRWVGGSLYTPSLYLPEISVSSK
ncbi:MAG: TldD/PmbA family protein [Dehalococcoidia bacterium]|nr:TldD/PmbA family protein [Dehalococcoidia bacterium]